LSHLQSLKLKSGTLQWAWCQLPHLTKLNLERFCKVMEYEASSEETCQIKDLEAELGTGILDPEFDTYGTSAPFLSLLPTLTRLVLSLCNTEFHEDLFRYAPFPYLEWECWGRFDALVGRLIAIATTLEHLVIWEGIPRYSLTTRSRASGYLYSSSEYCTLPEGVSAAHPSLLKSKPHRAFPTGASR
jgi:hypothetical protein